MDDPLQDLENELKALQPARPSALLTERVAQAMAASAEPAVETRRRRALPWLAWGLAASVALVVTLSWQHRRPSTAAPELQVAATQAASPDRYEPVDATNVLYDLQDEGPARLDDGSPARQMRYRYLDTYTWQNPRDKSSVKWSVPRDEIRVIPASLH